MMSLARDYDTEGVFVKLVVVVTVNHRGHKARQTSLHRRNKNVERALGILNLFTDDVTR